MRKLSVSIASQPRGGDKEEISRYRNGTVRHSEFVNDGDGGVGEVGLMSTKDEEMRKENPEVRKLPTHVKLKALFKHHRVSECHLLARWQWSNPRSADQEHKTRNRHWGTARAASSQGVL